MPEKIVLEQDKNIKTKEVERPVDTPAKSEAKRS